MIEPARHTPRRLAAPLIALALVGVAFLATWNSDDRDAGSSRGGEVLNTTDSVVAEAALRATAVDAAEPEQIVVPVVAAPVDSAPIGSFELRVRTVFPKVGGERRPAPGVSVSLGLGHDWLKHPEVYATALSDPDGLVSLRVTRELLAAVASIEAPRILLASLGPGLVRSWSWAKLPGADMSVLDTQHTVRPGVYLRGTLLGPDGEPCAGYVEAGRGRDHVEPDGRFEIAATREGPTQLVAKGRSDTAPEPEDALLDGYDLGTARSEPFEIAFDGSYEDLVIQVSGPGVLRGRVLESAGGPAAGLWLAASRVSGDGPSSSQRSGVIPDGGFTRRHVLTGAAGEFEISGLAAGSYRLVAHVEVDASEESIIELAHDPIPADGRPLMFTVSRPHLAIHVRGADGRATSSELEAFDVSLGGFHTNARDPWPVTPGVMVRPASGDAGFVPDGGPLRPWRVAAGEFVLEVPPGTSFDVSTFGGEHPPTLQRVVVPTDAGRVDVDVVLAPTRPRGELLVTVVDEAGVALHENVRLSLLDPATGFAFVREDSVLAKPEDWPHRFELPAATYVLSAEGVPTRFGQHGGVMWHRQAGAFEQLVKVAPNDVVSVEAMLGQGARLELELLGELNAADFEAAERELATWSSDHGSTVEDVGRRVMLHLERADREPVQALFRRSEVPAVPPGARYRPSTLTPWPLLGTNTRSEMLSPGRYTIVGRLPGGREARRDVELHEGQTTAVTLSFE